MHHKTLAILSILVLALGFSTIGSHLYDTPFAHAEEGGSGGSEGGSSGGSTGGGGGGGSGTSGGRGSHSGHRSNAIYAVARWLATHYIIGGLPPAGFGGGETPPMSSEEKSYLCAMQRFIKRNGFVSQPIVSYIAKVMTRTDEFVSDALRDPNLCNR